MAPFGRTGARGAQHSGMGRRARLCAAAQSGRRGELGEAASDAAATSRAVAGGGRAGDYPSVARGLSGLSAGGRARLRSPSAHGGPDRRACLRQGSLDVKRAGAAIYARTAILIVERLYLGAGFAIVARMVALVVGEMVRASGSTSVMEVIKTMRAPFIADYCVLFGLALLLVNFYVTATSQIEGATAAIHPKKSGAMRLPRPRAAAPNTPLQMTGLTLACMHSNAGNGHSQPGGEQPRAER
jgi:hypothetical protein